MLKMICFLSLEDRHPLRVIWKRGFIRLVLVVWWWKNKNKIKLLVKLIWVIGTSFVYYIKFLEFGECAIKLLACFVKLAICNKDGKVFTMLDTMGFVPKQHRSPIPVLNNPDSVIIPKRRTPDEIVENLSYVLEDDLVNSKSNVVSLFGGRQTWSLQENSFRLNSTMKAHCGFIRNGGEMQPVDVKYVKKCKFVVASGIFDEYDTPHQPSNLSARSQKLFCFLMAVDEKSFSFIKKNATVREDSLGGKWVGIWCLILLHHPPYNEPIRNGKLPKILTQALSTCSVQYLD